jgi:hypothetical protein
MWSAFGFIVGSFMREIPKIKRSVSAHALLSTGLNAHEKNNAIALALRGTILVWHFLFICLESRAVARGYV